MKNGKVRENRMCREESQSDKKKKGNKRLRKVGRRTKGEKQKGRGREVSVQCCK